MKVILSDRAEKSLRKSSKVIQIIIAKKIRKIKDSANVLNEERLEGFKNIFRIRIGDYRIVYRKTKNELYVVLLAHRREVYRLLKRLLG